uniref:Uncharacterized protein n=1 Tax=Peromyscus maniculatus bairdii TaxID=230844 RepID=A0A8C8UBB6_PERMB
QEVRFSQTAPDRAVWEPATPSTQGSPEGLLYSAYGWTGSSEEEAAVDTDVEDAVSSGYNRGRTSLLSQLGCEAFLDQGLTHCEGNRGNVGVVWSNFRKERFELICERIFKSRIIMTVRLSFTTPKGSGKGGSQLRDKIG